MALALRTDEVFPEDLPGDAELPSSDGEPMEIPEHRPQIYVLIESLELAWADRDDFYAGGNMFFYYSPRQVKKNDFRGPDLFVVLDTDRGRYRYSWVLWKEHKVPSLIVELLSPSTERVDRGEKMDIYAGLGVDDYFLYDTGTGRLEGYRLDRARGVYQPMPTGPLGRVYSPALDLWLGPVPHTQAIGHTFQMLRWFDASGRLLPTAAEAAEREAMRVKRLLDDERQRLTEVRLRAEEERLRAEEERLRAEEERLRAEEERLRAEEERLRADEAERRAREVEAMLAEYRQRFGALDKG